MTVRKTGGSGGLSFVGEGNQGRASCGACGVGLQRRRISIAGGRIFDGHGGGSGETRGQFGFFETNDARIRNFPAKVFELTELLVVLLEEDGATGIRDKGAGSGKADVPGAVMNFDGAAKKRRITSHRVSFQIGSSRVNSTNGLREKIGGKPFRDETHS